MKSKIKKIFFFLFIAVLVWSHFSKKEEEKPISGKVHEKNLVQTSSSSEERESVKLERVVDGDTLVVKINGKTKRVRLIGVDSPESTSVHVIPECYGTESSTYLKEKLKNEKDIFLIYDQVAGKYDKHDRILAHVFLASGLNINKEIILRGYAEEYTYKGQNYLYKNDYKKAESIAREANLGLWKNCK